MSKDTPTPPAPPDPVATANAQQNLNQNTATTQQLLNMTNQVTPQGSLTYSQTGSNTFTGADGKTYTVPQFTATQTLSPQEQALFNLGNQTQQNLAQIGVDQSAKIGNLLNTPFNGDQATEDKLDSLASARLDPQFAKEQAQLQTQLANQGIGIGSAAYNDAMTQFGQTKNDAYNQLYLNGNQQAFNQAVAERNQPINEITALMSGSQVSNPNFTSTPQTNVAGTDYAGMVQNQFNDQEQQYNTQMQQQNAMAGGLFGLGGTLGAAALQFAKPAAPMLMLSDRRLKSDIKRVGATAHGLPLYEYTIFGARQRGVMADEVKKVMPEAVVRLPSGFDAVDYGKLGLA
jgi:hypothetical protein